MGTTIINKAVQDAGGDFTLYRNNKISFCPKTALVVPVQNSMGQMGMQPTRFACSTNCPFASIEKGVPNFPGDIAEERYCIRCEGGKPLFIKLNEIQLHEPQKKQPGTIISINDKQ